MQHQTDPLLKTSAYVFPETSGTSGSKENFTDLATPCSYVSAYCRAVLCRLIPRQFWGDSQQGLENKNSVMASVDRFVHLRRFESMTLHTVLQGVKVNLSE